MANRIKVQVMGSSYHITTDRSEEKMRGIEHEVNTQIKAIQDAKPSLSLVNAVIMLALNLTDQLSAREEAMDRIREQLTQYMEDAARSQMELETVRQELARLRREQNNRM